MTQKTQLSRRQLLAAGSASVAAAGFAGSTASAQTERNAVAPDFKVTNKRIRQSVMGWCFKPMPVPELIGHCADIGLEAIEGISPEFYPEAIKQGLKISLVGSHPFAKGPNDPANHEMVISTLKKSIDTAVKFKSPSVITFTGMSAKGISEATQEENCIACWKQVLDYAEEKEITLVLEHLNSRDDSHPMKGHPGYFGDDVERCIDLVKRMDSPRFKLLFDVYHVQIMNGDVIRRIQTYKDYIGHYHTAGNPGRRELDEAQEINYPAVMKAILATGYDLYVAQEFIPTWDDPVHALRHSASVCDVS